MKKQLGDRYVMTNPQFYTPLEKDDMLVVIGNINLRIEDVKII
jgi:K+/H+ antiporter YhaU regulatory subunit KhtT